MSVGAETEATVGGVTSVVGVVAGMTVGGTPPLDTTEGTAVEGSGGGATLAVETGAVGCTLSETGPGLSLGTEVPVGRTAVVSGDTGPIDRDRGPTVRETGPSVGNETIGAFVSGGVLVLPAAVVVLPAAVAVLPAAVPVLPG